MRGTLMTVLLINEQLSLNSKPDSLAMYSNITEQTVLYNKPKRYKPKQMYELIACEGHPFYACGFKSWHQKAKING